jgi:hypothetical protein
VGCSSAPRTLRPAFRTLSARHAVARCCAALAVSAGTERVRSLGVSASAFKLHHQADVGMLHWQLCPVGVDQVSTTNSCDAVGDTFRFRADSVFPLLPAFYLAPVRQLYLFKSKHYEGRRLGTTTGRGN